MLNRLHIKIETGLWLILSLGCVYSILTLVDAWNVLFLPYSIERVEAFVLDGVLKIAEGNVLYSPISTNTFIIHPYNPLTYLPAGLVSKLFHLDTSDTLIFGRIISYLMTLMLALLLINFVWKNTRDWRATLFAGFSIYFFHMVAIWDFIKLRPESPALFFTFAAIILFCSNWRYKIYGAAILVFIAFLFKQSFISAPIAIFIFLLTRQEFKSAITFSTTLGGLLSAFFLAMYAITGEGYFHNAIASMAINEVRPIDNFQSYSPDLFSHTYGLILCLPFAIYAVRRDKQLGAFLLTYFLAALSWAFYSAGKIGSGPNYFSEFIIVSLLLVAVSIAISKQQRSAVHLIILALLGTQVIASTDFPPKAPKLLRAEYADLSAYIARYDSLPGEKLILHEQTAIHMGNPIAYDWYLLELLEQKGLISFDSIFDAISKGEYSNIVFSTVPISSLEVSEQVQFRIWQAVENGPYIRTYSDPNLIEWSSL